MSERARAPGRVVIVGGGLSGLVTAMRLQKESDRHAVPLELSVIEASPRLGGNLSTEHHEGFVIDPGPDSWVSAKPEATELAQELGLGNELIETVAANRRVYLVHRGELVALPEGLVLGVPTRLGPVLRSPLLSPFGRARIALDLVLSRRPIDDDISIGELVAQRMGTEVVEALTEPLLAGIYADDAWSLSARSTFPKLIEFASRKSLLRAARSAAPRRSGGALPSSFMSLRHGVGSLIDALEKNLPPGSIRRSVRACKVSKVPDGHSGPKWAVTLDDGGLLLADRVVLALPSHSAAKLVESTLPSVGRALGAITWSSAATVFFAWKREVIPHAMNATGFIVPRRENRAVMAATWVSSKWPGRAPEGMALVRAFVGGARSEDSVKLSDGELTAMALDELSSIMGVRAKPQWSKVYRFIESAPQPRVGHAARVQAIQDTLGQHPGLYALGSWRDGAGIPDVIRGANVTARAMVITP